MSRKRIALAILMMSTLITLPVFAQTTNTTEQPTKPRVEVKTLRDNLKKDIEQKKQEIADKRSEVKDKVAELRSRELNNKVRQDIKVFTATADRLDKIVTRIESRVTKIKAAGGTTTDIEAQLTLGKASLALGRSDIAAFSAIDLTSATSSTTVRTLLDSIKADAQKAKTDLKATQEYLIKATTLIQGVEKKVKVKDNDSEEATTTKSTN